MELSFLDFLKIIRRKLWLVIIIVFGISSITAYMNYFYLTPYYSNSSTLLVNDRNMENTPSLNDVLVYEKLIGTYKDIIKSKKILTPVVVEYGRGLSYEQLVGMLNVSSKPSSQVITITVISTNYIQATTLANLIAETFSRLLPNVMTVDNVQILDAAEQDSTPLPVKPRKKLNVFLSFFLSTFVSVALILILYLLDTKIRTEEDLIQTVNYPLLGSVPKINNKKVRYSPFY